jgi:carbon-monoxide dehydrogenase medium subunit
MIPAQFDYATPTTIADAVKLLAQHSDDAKVLAGGHSLIPAMKLRLAQPQLLIDLGRIKDLSYIREEGSKILIGAMTTHYQLESSKTLKELCPLLSECAASIGDVQVRNKGTIGGSLAHADPAADWPAAVIALHGEIVAVGSKGERVINVDDFFIDLLTTALQPGEIIREIRIERPPDPKGQAYQKVPHPASGFAVVGVAVNLKLKTDSVCEAAGVGVTGVAAKAYRASGVEAALLGQKLNEQTIATAAAHAVDGIETNSDLYASGEYRADLARIHTRRALTRLVR